MKQQTFFTRGGIALAAAVLALGALSAPQARAAYPDRPLRIVVPFTPGGGTDSPIALPAGIDLPPSMAETLLPSDVIGLARIVPRVQIAA